MKQAYYIYSATNSMDMDGLNKELSQAKLELNKYSSSVNIGRNETDIQHFMIDFISKRGNSVILNRVLEPHFFEVNGYKVINQSFEIEGSFKSTVQLIYELETTKDPVFLKTLKLVSRKNHTTNKYELFTVIYVQSVKNNR